MSIGIGLGFAGFPFSSPAAFMDWVDLVETQGVDSLWLSDRLVSDRAALEPISALAVIAGRTSRLKFGMNAVVLPHRDPLVLAKECATLDFLSGGRLLPVFGVGSPVAPEWRATGQPMEGRGVRSDEMLQILRLLWSEDNVTFEGKHFTYRNVTISPKPKQRELPLWIGGSSDAAIRRTARYGTGWLAGTQSPSSVRPVVAKIREAVLAAGRTIDDDHYGAGFSYRFGAKDEPAVQMAAAGLQRISEGGDPFDSIAVGDAGTIISRIQEYIEAGVSKFVLRPIATSDSDLNDQTTRLISEVLPAFSATR